MRDRVSGRATSTANSQITLRCLLNIKLRREQRLRRQSAEINQRRQQQQMAIEKNQTQRTHLLMELQQLLDWTGTLSVDELQQQKQTMAAFFQQERQLAVKQQSLQSELCVLQSEQDTLQQSLNIVLKKQEKLRILLGD